MFYKRCSRSDVQEPSVRQRRAIVVATKEKPTGDQENCMRHCRRTCLLAALLIAAASVSLHAQGRGIGGPGPDDKQIIDADAAARGRKTYIAECITCHGPKARGTEEGADLMRSLVVLRDRYGSEIGAH